MKNTIIFIVATLAIVFASNYYLHYCVSRPCSELVSIPLGIVVIVALVIYVKYVINLIVKLLKF